MKNFLLGTVILVGSIGVANASVTNIVKNGSFEANQMSSGHWGFVALTDWTSQGDTGNALGKTELRDNIAGAASDGHNFVELDGNRNSSITQVLNTIANQTYTFSFDFANRLGTSAATNGLKWEFGNYFGNVGGIGASTNWSAFTQNFVATSNATTIKFTAIGVSDSLGSSLDNVSVTAVPEPEEWAMMMLGLPFMGFVSARRRRS